MKKALIMALAATVISMPALANEKKFEEMDTNNDGTVSKAEFDAHKDTWFKEADTNNDGSLSKDELSSATKKKWEAVKEKAHDTKEKIKEKTE